MRYFSRAQLTSLPDRSHLHGERQMSEVFIGGWMPADLQPPLRCDACFWILDRNWTLARQASVLCRRPIAIGRLSTADCQSGRPHLRGQTDGGSLLAKYTLNPSARTFCSSLQVSHRHPMDLRHRGGDRPTSERRSLQHPSRPTRERCVQHALSASRIYHRHLRLLELIGAAFCVCFFCFLCCVLLAYAGHAFRAFWGD